MHSLARPAHTQHVKTCDKGHRRRCPSRGRIAPAITVAAKDASGTLVSSFTGSVTLAFGTNATGSTLGGTTSVAAVAGVATFSNISLNKAGTGYTLVASSG